MVIFRLVKNITKYCNIELDDRQNDEISSVIENNVPKLPYEISAMNLKKLKNA